jgi:hypothetical protein
LKIVVKLDRQALALHIAAILRCADCRPAGAWPHAPWVGWEYEPGGIVLLAQNPSDTRPLTNQEESALTDLMNQANQGALQTWSALRISGNPNSSSGQPFPAVREWGQWKRGFKLAVGPCLKPEKTAWLNVVNHTGAINSAGRRHGRTHLDELLAALCPRAVVTRYDAARDALAYLSGPWQHYDRQLLHLSGGGGQRSTVSQDTGDAVHRTLHEQFALPRDATCPLS